MNPRQRFVGMHPHIHDPGHIKGVRTVATVEFAKGIIVVLAGLGVFVALMHRVSDVRLWKIATVATIYVTLRFVEAYGLWYVRPWAEWLAFASGAIYIPFEAADLLRRPDWFRLLVIVVNVGIVLYMLMLRLEAAKKRHAAQHAAESG